MNSLSWFIYLAEVLHNLGNTAFVFSLGGMFVSFGLLVGTIAVTAAASTDKDAETFKPTVVFMNKLWWPIWVVCILLANFLPKKDTMYMIAASEAGQMIVENKATQEVLGEVKDVIMGKLKQMKENK